MSLTNQEIPTVNGLDHADESDQVSPSPDKLIKHQLQNSWTLWFFKQDPNKSWEDCQMKIATFQTVEDFWGLYNHLEIASRLKPGCDYSLFKNDIKPMWEDSQNREGGRWLLSLGKGTRSIELDIFWMELSFLLIGEGFKDHNTEICGAVVNVRAKGDKVGLWTRDYKIASNIMTIGSIMKACLNLPPHYQISFQSHRDVAVKRGSSLRALYEV